MHAKQTPVNTFDQPLYALAYSTEVARRVLGVYGEDKLVIKFGS